MDSAMQDHSLCLWPFFRSRSTWSTSKSVILANWIRLQGYDADSHPGPMAGALLLILPAIAAGLGELGKHGSLISPSFGSGVRLVGVTTDVPLAVAMK